MVLTSPFRAPPQTISAVGLIGGGQVPTPGDVSLAHHGVRCLDELPECRHVLEALCQPLGKSIASSNLSHVLDPIALPAIAVWALTSAGSRPAQQYPSMSPRPTLAQGATFRLTNRPTFPILAPNCYSSVLSSVRAAGKHGRSSRCIRLLSTSPLFLPPCFAFHLTPGSS